MTYVIYKNSRTKNNKKHLQGQRAYFCSKHCEEEFEKNSEKYASKIIKQK
jgi:YHS domain-containing protein